VKASYLFLHFLNVKNAMVAALLPCAFFLSAQAQTVDWSGDVDPVPDSTSETQWSVGNLYVATTSNGALTISGVIADVVDLYLGYGVGTVGALEVFGGELSARGNADRVCRFERRRADDLRRLAAGFRGDHGRARGHGLFGDHRRGIDF